MSSISLIPISFSYPHSNIWSDLSLVFLLFVSEIKLILVGCCNEWLVQVLLDSIFLYFSSNFVYLGLIQKSTLFLSILFFLYFITAKKSQCLKDLLDFYIWLLFSLRLKSVDLYLIFEMVCFSLRVQFVTICYLLFTSAINL